MRGARIEDGEGLVHVEPVVPVEDLEGVELVEHVEDVEDVGDVDSVEPVEAVEGVGDVEDVVPVGPVGGVENAEDVVAAEAAQAAKATRSRRRPRRGRRGRVAGVQHVVEDGEECREHGRRASGGGWEDQRSRGGRRQMGACRGSPRARLRIAAPVTADRSRPGPRSVPQSAAPWPGRSSARRQRTWAGCGSASCRRG